MHASEPFDFDRMARLAAEAPAEFARARAKLIEQAILSFQIEEQGYRLQGEIDLHRMSHSLGEQTFQVLTGRIMDLVEQMRLLAEELHME